MGQTLSQNRSSGLEELGSAKIVCFSKSGEIVFRDMNKQGPLCTVDFTFPDQVTQTDRGGDMRRIEMLPDSNLLLMTATYDFASHFQILDTEKSKITLESGILFGCISDIAISRQNGLAAFYSQPFGPDCHFFDLNTLEFVKKTKKNGQNKGHNVTQAFDLGLVDSLHFNVEGSKLAKYTSKGCLMITDVSNDIVDLKYENLGGVMANLDSYNCCRWVPLHESSCLAIKLWGNRLNLFDAEKNAFLYSNHFKLNGNWRCDANLLATASGKGAEILDRRIGKLLKSHNNLHKSRVSSVRWSPSGKYLASSSFEHGIKIIDFSTGKVVFQVKDAKKNNEWAMCFLDEI